MANFADIVSAQELVGEGSRAGTKIVVRGLKRDDGGTVTLRFQVVNDGNTSQPCTSLSAIRWTAMRI
jgi:hypothetical protein